MLNTILIALALILSGILAGLAFLTRLTWREILILGVVILFLGLPAALLVHALAQGVLSWSGQGIFVLCMGAALMWLFFQVLREALT